MLTRAAWLSVALVLAGCRHEAGTGGTRRTSDPAVAAARAEADVPAIGYAAVNARGVIAIGGEGATEDTIFDAASIAKLVVGVAVMQLVDEGKASLDGDVSAYVGFPVSHRRKAITLRMLLSHTSRIRDHDLVEGPEVPLGDYLRGYLVERGASAFDDGEPGSAYAYSNVGFALAAYVVECVRSTPFAEATRKRVFQPLAMTHATWSKRIHAVWPAADLHASARDLARFARMFLRGGELDGERVLSREAAELLLGGLAFQRRSFGVGHEGEDRGASTALFLDLAKGTGAVVLANGDAFASGDPARAGAIQDLVVDLLAR